MRALLKRGEEYEFVGLYPDFYTMMMEKLTMALAIPDDPDAHRAEEIKRREAHAQQGFTGDCCTNCGNFRMRRSGTCLFCEVCGTTTGCS